MPPGTRVMPTRFGARLAAAPNLALTYGGGPVLRYPRVYVVFWGFTTTHRDPAGEEAYLTAYLSGVGGSPWMNIDHQYYQIVGSADQHIVNTASQLKGAWVDTSDVPAAPSDAQVQAEAVRLQRHFGFFKYASYVVATPHEHNTPGFASTFCGYHAMTTSPGGTISFTNLPYMSDGGFNCGNNAVNSGAAGLNDGVSIVAGHEYAESQTDPQPVSGWNSTGGEIGDVCAWNFGLKNIALATGSFAVQPLFSDKTSSCVFAYP